MAVSVTPSEGGGNELERSVPENLHYDLPVILKGRKKERQDRG
jgi:hypothetical protein